jgi:hypothetical protein
LDGTAQIGLQGFDLQMIMISHQHEGMNPERKPARHDLQQLQEMLVGAIVREQLASINATIHYMVPAVWYRDAKDDSSSRSLPELDRHVKLRC